MKINEYDPNENARNIPLYSPEVMPLFKIIDDEEKEKAKAKSTEVPVSNDDVELKLAAWKFCEFRKFAREDPIDYELKEIATGDIVVEEVSVTKKKKKRKKSKKEIASKNSKQKKKQKKSKEGLQEDGGWGYSDAGASASAGEYTTTDTDGDEDIQRVFRSSSGRVIRRVQYMENDDSDFEDEEDKEKKALEEDVRGGSESEDMD